MDINLIDSNRLEAWVSQFDVEDRDCAYSLLQDITFIDQVEYDRYVNNIAESISKKSINYDYVYIIPIGNLHYSNEPKSDSDFAYNIKKKLKINKKIFWGFPKKREDFERNSIVFLVDEYVGSGGSIRNSILKIPYLDRLKSLTSYKKIEFYICSIVMYKAARNLLNREYIFIKGFLYEVEGLSFDLSKYHRFLNKYTVKKNCKEAMYGFNKGNLQPIFGSVILFNNCPNNTPSILWCRQKNKPTPIFANKKVFLRYASNYYKERKRVQSIVRYDWKEYKHEFENYNYSIFIDTMLFIYKFNKGMTIDSYIVWSQLSKSKITVLISLAKELQYLKNIHKISITSIGKHVAGSIEQQYIELYSEIKHRVVNKSSVENSKIILYYPSQIKGIKLNV